MGLWFCGVKGFMGLGFGLHHDFGALGKDKGHFQVGSCRCRSLVEGLYTL